MSSFEIPNAARRIPTLKLPLYAYVPGRNPHPFKDPDGHRYGAEWNFPYEQNWREDQGWLLGLDLFDFGFYWECHELWEAQWRTRPRNCVSRQLLQGMIQSAAALLKPVGSRAAKRLWTSANQRLLQAVAFDRGIDLHLTMASIATALDGGERPRIVGGWP